MASHEADAEIGKRKMRTHQMEEPLLVLHKEDSKGSIAVVLLSTFVAVLGSYEFGSCVGYSTPVQASISKDLHLSLAEYSLFGSLVTIGAMMGAITSGRIAEGMGRKWAMRVASVFCITGWAAIYFSKGALLLDAGRFLTGYGIGIYSYVVPMYIGEIAPKDVRGALATMNQLMIVLGAATAFIVGTLVTWRTLALTGIVPCLIQLLILVFIPESPRWLAKVGYEKEFEDSLKRLRGGENDDTIAQEAAEIKDYLKMLEGLPKIRMLDLFQKRYLHALLIGIGLMVLQQFGGANGFGFYAGQTFVSAGFSSGKLGIILFAGLQIPITLLGAFLMDNCGRKPLLLVSATGTFLGCFLAGTSFFLIKDQNSVHEWVPILVLAGLLLYTGSFSVGMGAIPWIIMSEIFPINIKGEAGSLVNLIHWVCAWTVSYTFNLLMDWSSSGTFFIYSGFCATAVLFVAKVVPETKGRTLEEIQASINSF